jgi:hypothetical protein
MDLPASRTVSRRPLGKLSVSGQAWPVDKPEWPGVATTVGIVLILALIVVGSRDDFHLKDWQTLMAGAFVLCEVMLAYWGAMAKIKQDGDLHRRDF